MHRRRIALTGSMVMILAACLRTSPAARTGVTSVTGSACPAGAAPVHSACACRPDLRLLLGACVSPRTAADHCGTSASVTADGCAPRPPCGSGQARDLVSGDCIPRRDVRGLASSLGILVADDDLVGCASGGELVMTTIAIDARADGPARLGCLPLPLRSRPAVCPAGSILGGDGKCARVFEEAHVDVVRWLQAAIGPEGGRGAPPLCDALARAPRSLDVQASPSLVVSLAFPDNDVSLVVARVRVVGDPAATAELERVVAPMIEALRSYGGTASHASLGTSVNCRRTAPERASSMPIPPD